MEGGKWEVSPIDKEFRWWGNVIQPEWGCGGVNKAANIIRLLMHLVALLERIAKLDLTVLNLNIIELEFTFNPLISNVLSIRPIPGVSASRFDQRIDSFLFIPLNIFDISHRQFTDSKEYSSRVVTYKIDENHKGYRITCQLL
jgi:hypothetical protein